MRADCAPPKAYQPPYFFVVFTAFMRAGLHAAESIGADSMKRKKRPVQPAIIFSVAFSRLREIGISRFGGGTGNGARIAEEAKRRK